MNFDASNLEIRLPVCVLLALSCIPCGVKVNQPYRLAKLLLNLPCLHINSMCGQVSPKSVKSLCELHTWCVRAATSWFPASCGPSSIPEVAVEATVTNPAPENRCSHHLLELTCLVAPCVCVCLTVYAIEATFEGLSKRTGIAGVPSTGWQKHGVITRKAIFTCPYISGKKEKLRGVFSLGRSPQPSDCTPFFRPERALHVASLALVVLVPNGRSSLVLGFPCN